MSVRIPKALGRETTATVVDDVEVETARNDPPVNSFNPVQLSAWRANVDMQYCVSRHKVIQYCAKYATKCEPRSQMLKDVFATVVRGLNEDDKSLKAVQKLINTTAERDYSAQEACHLLQLPMFLASRDFVILSLNGSRQVEEHLQEGQPATAPSPLDHYISQLSTPHFEDMTLLHFTQHHSMPKSVGDEPSLRRKAVVIIVRPFCSPDPNGPNYGQYCTQKLILHRPFREYHHLLAGFNTHAAAYAHYLQSGNIPSCLEDDIHRLQQQEQQNPVNEEEEHEVRDEQQ